MPTIILELRCLRRYRTQFRYWLSSWSDTIICLLNHLVKLALIFFKIELGSSYRLRLVIRSKISLLYMCHWVGHVLRNTVRLVEALFELQKIKIYPFYKFIKNQKILLNFHLWLLYFINLIFDILNDGIDVKLKLFRIAKNILNSITLFFQDFFNLCLFLIEVSLSFLKFVDSICEST